MTWDETTKQMAIVKEAWLRFDRELTLELLNLDLNPGQEIRPVELSPR